jgi:hypothetical protein
MRPVGKLRQTMNGFWHVKTRLLLAALLALGPAFSVFADPPPDAREILRSVRLAQAAQRLNLRGQLRTGGQKIPFRLVVESGTVRYDFSDPPQSIVLRLGDKGSRLEEVAGGNSERVSPAQFDDKVRGTDISYEDLSMRFLYWPAAAVQGEETKLLRRCWKVRVEPGGAESQYSMVMLWVEQESGALLQAEAYDKAGSFARRFSVRSVQKSEGAWILKQMRIEAAPAPGAKDRTPTYLEIEAPGR